MCFATACVPQQIARHKSLRVHSSLPWFSNSGVPTTLHDLPKLGKPAVNHVLPNCMRASLLEPRGRSLRQVNPHPILSCLREL